MGKFYFLSRFFRRTDAAPVMVGQEFRASGIELADSSDMEVSESGESLTHSVADQKSPKALKRVDDDLWGVTFAIEYRDSKGQKTTRRITLRDILENTQGVRYLRAICHERQAVRCFRFDRVCSIIDMDGVIHDPRVFFERELRISYGSEIDAVTEERDTTVTSMVVSQQVIREPDRPGMAHRRAARDGLRLLVALGRSDGLLADAELEVVLHYIARKADGVGLDTSDADIAALVPYLKRQFPGAPVLSECLARIESEPVEDRLLFLRSALQLIDADGAQHPAEFEMMLELQRQIARS